PRPPRLRVRFVLPAPLAVGATLRPPGASPERDAGTAALFQGGVTSAKGAKALSTASKVSLTLHRKPASPGTCCNVSPVGAAPRQPPLPPAPSPQQTERRERLRFHFHQAHLLRRHRTRRAGCRQQQPRCPALRARIPAQPPHVGTADLRSLRRDALHRA